MGVKHKHMPQKIHILRRVDLVDFVQKWKNAVLVNNTFLVIEKVR